VTIVTTTANAARKDTVPYGLSRGRKNVPSIPVDASNSRNHGKLIEQLATRCVPCRCFGPSPAQKRSVGVLPRPRPSLGSSSPKASRYI
jgi:hypothetical protein